MTKTHTPTEPELDATFPGEAALVPAWHDRTEPGQLDIRVFQRGAQVVTLVQRPATWDLVYSNGGDPVVTATLLPEEVAGTILAL
jgi:hypothetical protein